MATIPFPNIAEQAGEISSTPQNSMAEYARIAALKQQTAENAAMAPLRQQQAQQAIEAQRRQFADQDALTKAITQYDPDKHTLADIPRLITSNGGSGGAALQAQAGLVQQRQNLLKLSDEQFAQEQRKADLIQGVHDAVSEAPPEQKQPLYQRGLQTLAHAGVDVSKEPLQYPGDDVFAQHLPPIRLHSAILAEAEKDREVSAKEQEAQAKATEAKTIGERLRAEMPGGPLASVDKTEFAAYMKSPDSIKFGGPAGYSAFKAQQEAVATAPQKIAVAEAEGRARANIEAQVARGSNAALSEVPPHLIGPATAAATKAGEDYAAAQAVTQRMNATMDAARKGNKVSYQIIPQEGTLQLTTSQGVHRINRTEIDQYAGGGNLWDRLVAHAGKALTGQSIPDNILSDMAAIQKIQAEGSQSKYENSLKTINQTYGAKFQPVKMDMKQPATAAETKTYQGHTYAKQPDGTYKLQQ